MIRPSTVWVSALRGDTYMMRRKQRACQGRHFLMYSLHMHMGNRAFTWMSVQQ